MHVPVLFAIELLPLIFSVNCVTNDLITLWATAIHGQLNQQT